MPRHGHFTPALFTFLRQLARNNRRDWFEANKARYLQDVRDPMLRFITDLGPRLRAISPHVVADPSPVGGSMFRIYRDVRFAKDKRPYKTAATARFQHEAGKNVHTPGWYLHLGVDGVYAASGIWHPDTPTLTRIRLAMIEDPTSWKRAKGAATRKRRHALGGDALKRPPRGFDPDHPLAEDLKRKDIVTWAELDEKTACSPRFLDTYAGLCRDTAPLVRWLAGTLDLDW